MDIVERLKFDAARCEVDYSTGIASNIGEAVNEIERLRAALKPFAAIPLWSDSYPDAGSDFIQDDRLRRIFTTEDVHRARRALVDDGT